MTLQAGAMARGFTLLELLVVLAVAAIATAVVGTGAQAFMERSQYHRAIRAVGAQLAQARTISMQEGRKVVVLYQPQARRLFIDTRHQVELPQSVEVSWTSLPGAGTPAMPVDGAPLFIFSSDGAAQSGAFSITRAGQGVVFRVNWLLGTVEQAPVAGAA